MAGIAGERVFRTKCAITKSGDTARTHQMARHPGIERHITIQLAAGYVDVVVGSCIEASSATTRSKAVTRRTYVLNYTL